MRKQFLALLLGLVAPTGCGGPDGEVVMPDTPLTEEQKAAIKAQDEQIQDEEGGVVLKFDKKAD